MLICIWHDSLCRNLQGNYKKKSLGNNEFNKVANNKMNMQISTAFLYANKEHTVTKVKKHL